MYNGTYVTNVSADTGASIFRVVRKEYAAISVLQGEARICDCSKVELINIKGDMRIKSKRHKSVREGQR